MSESAHSSGVGTSCEREPTQVSHTPSPLLCFNSTPIAPSRINCNYYDITHTNHLVREHPFNCLIHQNISWKSAHIINDLHGAFHKIWIWCHIWWESTDKIWMWCNTHQFIWWESTHIAIINECSLIRWVGVCNTTLGIKRTLCHQMGCCVQHVPQ